MKIVFLASGPDFPDLRKLYWLYAKELINRNAEVEFLTDSNVFERYILEKGMNVVNIRNLMKGIEEYSEENLLKYLKKYSIPSLEEFCFAEIQCQKLKKSYLKMEVYNYLATLETYFDATQPRCIFTSGEDLLIKTCDKVAKKKNILILHQAGGIVPNTLCWEETIMINEWIEKEHLNKDLSLEEKEKVLEYMETIKNKKPILGGGPRKILFPKNWIKFIDYAYKYYFIEKCRTKNYPPIQFAKSYFLRLIRKNLARKYYKNQNFNEKYILFPLQVPDDNQIILRAILFYRQDKVVEMCAKALPKGYILYVKEHPYAKGKYPLKWLERIASLPNAKLIPPDINIHDLIKNSEAIVTINSDVGWEALLYHKPVITLAKPFYAGFGVTFDTNCLKYLNDTTTTVNELCLKRLSEKIEEALAIKQIDEEKVYKLINAAFKSLYFGCSFLKNYYELNYDANNIKKIADSILDIYSKKVAS